MAETQEIPLFPLGTVLFPNQLLPLRIFEERYKLMIGECLEGGHDFGAVLIRQGREVGGPSIPFETGTTAHIAEHQRYEDGRYSLKSVGRSPFRLLRVTQQRPYMKGEIEYIHHEVGDTDALDQVMAQVKEQFLTHIEFLAEMSGREKIELNLDIDPANLSYLVASILAIQMPEKQALLEMRRADHRLQEESNILTRENRALQSFMNLRRQKQGQPPDQGDLLGRISLN